MRIEGEMVQARKVCWVFCPAEADPEGAGVLLRGCDLCRSSRNQEEARRVGTARSQRCFRPRCAERELCVLVV